MRYQFWYRVALALGLGFLAIAAFLYLRQRQDTPGVRDEPAVVVEDAPGLVINGQHQVLDDVPAGTSRDVEFLIENRTEKPIQLVGARYGCTTECCFGLKRELPLDVPGHGSVNIIYSIHTATGFVETFTSRLTLYANDGGLRAIPLTVEVHTVKPPKDGAVQSFWPN